MYSRIVKSVLIGLVVSLFVGGGALAQEQVKIVVATWQNTDRFVEQLVEDYRASHPHVEVEIRELGSSADFKDGVTLMMAGGQQLDLLYASSSAGLHWAPMGWVEPLNAFLERDGLSLDHMPPMATTSVDIFNDGTIWGLPFVAFTTTLSYNKDLFDASGLSYPNSNWRWEQEFEEAARRLTRDAAGDGTIDVYGARFNAGASHIAYGAMRSWGIEVLDPTLRKPALNSSETVEFMNFWLSLISDLEIVTTGGNWNGGGLGMYVDGMGSTTNTTAFDWDVELMPIGPSGRRASYGDTNNWVMMKGSRHKDEVWEFMKFLWVEAPRYWSEQGLRLPIVPYSDPTHWSFAPGSAAYAAGYGPKDHMIYFEMLESAEIWPRVAELEMRTQVWDAVMKQVLSGDLWPEAAAEEMNRLGETFLRDWWALVE